MSKLAKQIAAAYIKRLDSLMNHPAKYDEKIVELGMDLAHEVLMPGFREKLEAKMKAAR